MDDITTLIKNEILRQYGSVRKFSEASGIPYSTLSNAFAKGVGGTSYDTVVKICGLLHIKQAYDAGSVLINEEFYNFYNKLAKLDALGVHTVCSVINTELARCANEDPTGTKKAYNGMGLASKYKNQVSTSEITELVKHIQSHES